MKKKKEPHSTYYTFLESPVGRLLLVADERGLKLVNFQDGRHPMDPDPEWREDRRPFKDVIKQFMAYFSKRSKNFTLKCTLNGTPFQQKVWQALRSIPYGQTVSYGDLARRIGHPNASRAVGAANGKNPLSIIFPCHRVIGHSGELVGYGGGIPIKQSLLALEHRHVNTRKK